MSFLSRPIAVVLLSAAALVIPASAQDVAAASVVGSRSAASLPDTWNAVNDFNQTNAPGGVFTYGVGLLPGQFARMGTVVANTVGTPTTFISNGGSQPYVSFVLWNGMSTNTSDNTINPSGLTCARSASCAGSPSLRPTRPPVQPASAQPWRTDLWRRSASPPARRRTI